MFSDQTLTSIIRMFYIKMPFFTMYIFFLEFIGLMAEDVPTYHIFDLSKQVDEFNVTVDVIKLIPKKELVLNKSVQESAKKFFTPDAWKAVQQTLRILKGKLITLLFHFSQK